MVDETPPNKPSSGSGKTNTKTRSSSGGAGCLLAFIIFLYFLGRSDVSEKRKPAADSTESSAPASSLPANPGEGPLQSAKTEFKSAPRQEVVPLQADVWKLKPERRWVRFINSCGIPITVGVGKILYFRSQNNPLPLGSYYIGKNQSAAGTWVTVAVYEKDEYIPPTGGETRLSVDVDSLNGIFYYDLLQKYAGFGYQRPGILESRSAKYWLLEKDPNGEDRILRLSCR